MRVDRRTKMRTGDPPGRQDYPGFIRLIGEDARFPGDQGWDERTQARGTLPGASDFGNRFCDDVDDELRLLQRDPVPAVRCDDVPAARREAGERLLLPKAVIAGIG